MIYITIVYKSFLAQVTECELVYLWASDLIVLEGNSVWKQLQGPCSI